MPSRTATTGHRRTFRCTSFKDRLEILSPGGLPMGMTEADLGTKSVPRNPLLFGMLFRMDVVEQVGSGVRRMLLRCREHGVPQPRIDVSEHWVTVTFHRDGQFGGEHSASPSKRLEPRYACAGEGGQPESDVGGEEHVSVSRPVEGHPQSAGRSLVRRVVALFAGGPMSKSAIARNLGHRPGSDGLKRVIRRLLRCGLVEYTLPERPSGSRQEYRLSQVARAAQAVLGAGASVSNGPLAARSAAAGVIWSGHGNVLPAMAQGPILKILKPALPVPQTLLLVAMKFNVRSEDIRA